MLLLVFKDFDNNFYDDSAIILVKQKTSEELSIANRRENRDEFSPQREG